jgi:hypothetical protein
VVGHHRPPTERREIEQQARAVSVLADLGLTPGRASKGTGDPKASPDRPRTTSSGRDDSFSGGQQMLTDEQERATRRAALALLAAVLDQDCDNRAGDILTGAGAHPQLPSGVEHWLPHSLNTIDPGDYQPMRADLQAELLGLAGDD